MEFIDFMRRFPKAFQIMGVLIFGSLLISYCSSLLIEDENPIKEKTAKIERPIKETNPPKTVMSPSPKTFIENVGRLIAAEQLCSSWFYLDEEMLNISLSNLLGASLNAIRAGQYFIIWNTGNIKAFKEFSKIGEAKFCSQVARNLSEFVIYDPVF